MCSWTSHLLLILSHRTEVETVLHADNDFATVAFLRIKKASLDPKDEQRLEDIPAPSLLDDSILCVRDAVFLSQESISSEAVLADPLPISEYGMSNSCSKRLGSWVAVGNLHRELSESMSEISVEEELRECFQKLQSILVFRTSLRPNITNNGSD